MKIPKTPPQKYRGHDLSAAGLVKLICDTWNECVEVCTSPDCTDTHTHTQEGDHGCWHWFLVYGLFCCSKHTKAEWRSAETVGVRRDLYHFKTTIRHGGKQPNIRHRGWSFSRQEASFRVNLKFPTFGGLSSFNITWGSQGFWIRFSAHSSSRWVNISWIQDLQTGMDSCLKWGEET